MYRGVGFRVCGFEGRKVSGSMCEVWVWGKCDVYLGFGLWDVGFS